MLMDEQVDHGPILVQQKVGNYKSQIQKIQTNHKSTIQAIGN